MMIDFEMESNTTITQSTKRKKDEQTSTNLHCKKVKVTCQPIYDANTPASKTLHDCFPNGLEFKFDQKTTSSSIVKFICYLSITTKTSNHHDSALSVNEFFGEGASKKEAKNDCCQLALATLFPDSYKVPKQESDGYKYEMKKKFSKLVQHRANELVRYSQILNELDARFADAGNIDEARSSEQKFCYRITNVYNHQWNPNDESNLAYGYGKSKKEAKNEAAKEALKKFFEIDV